MEPFQIISDGKTMFLIHGEQAIRIENPILINSTMSVRDSSRLIPTESGKNYFMSGPKWIELDFSVRSGGECEMISTDEVFLDFIDKATIQELIYGINRKINERKEK